MIKFKEAGNGQFIRISLDDEGNELSRTATFSEKNKPKTFGAGLWLEMQKWIADENVVEMQYTAEELAEKETDDLSKALESQRAICIQLLDDSDKKIVSDSPYSVADQDEWKVFREKLRTIIKATTIKDIPTKPF